MASGPGRRKVAEVTRVPSRIVDVSRASPTDSWLTLAGLAGHPAHGQEVVGAEERVVAGVLGGPGHPQLVVVVGALLGLDEDPQVHVGDRSARPGYPRATGTGSRFPT